MREDIQAEVDALWKQVTTDNIYDITDLEGYRKEFFQLFGFETEGVNYEEDIDTEVHIPNLI
ncbi:putative reductase [compost metagenome]